MLKKSSMVLRLIKTMGRRAGADEIAQKCVNVQLDMMQKCADTYRGFDEMAISERFTYIEREAEERMRSTEWEIKETEELRREK